MDSEVGLSIPHRLVLHVRGKINAMLLAVQNCFVACVHNIVSLEFGSGYQRPVEKLTDTTLSLSGWGISERNVPLCGISAREADVASQTLLLGLASRDGGPQPS